MKINKVYKDFLKNEKRYKIAYGGSASGKSYAIAQEIILLLLTTNRNFLCIRKISNTIRDSIFSLLLKIIIEENLYNFFHINKTELTITNLERNNQILCKGLDDPEKIKSITTKIGIITDIWIEEATELQEDDFNQLDLRLRGESEYFKQIWMSFNPISSLHWIKKRFFDKINEECIIIKTTYKNNAFLNKNDIKAIESLKNNDPIYYQVYALGEWGVLGSLVFKNWKVENLSELKDKFSNYNVGLDFGFTNDPTVLLLTAFHNKKIYILKEFYQKGMLNNEIAKIIKKEFNGYYIYADCAEPKSISELNMHGLNIIPVKKGKDSIIHGIEWLKQYEIIIDESCKYTINEIQGYKYKEDKDGNILNEPIGINDHCIDSLRYSTENLMLSTKMLKNIKITDLGI